MGETYPSIDCTPHWTWNVGYMKKITLKINRNGIPNDIKEVKNRELSTSKVYWQEDRPLTMMLYAVKTSTGKKNVLLLTTTEPILGVTKDDKREKFRKYKLYDFTKVENGLVDQRIGFLTCKTKSRKWKTVAFSYVLDMARVKSSTIQALSDGKDPLKQHSFKFGFDLMMELVKPFIDQRNMERLNWFAHYGTTATAAAYRLRVGTLDEREKRAMLCMYRGDYW